MTVPGTMKYDVLVKLLQREEPEQGNYFLPYKTWGRKGSIENYSRLTYSKVLGRCMAT